MLVRSTIALMASIILPDNARAWLRSLFAHYYSTNPPKSRKELAAHWGISVKNAENRIRKLVGLGCIYQPSGRHGAPIILTQAGFDFLDEKRIRLPHRERAKESRKEASRVKRRAPKREEKEQLTPGEIWWRETLAEGL